jgi:hypothetical protein
VNVLSSKRELGLLGSCHVVASIVPAYPRAGLNRTAGIALKSVGTPDAGTRQILASDGGGCGVACSADGPRRAAPDTDYAGGT